MTSDAHRCLLIHQLDGAFKRIERAEEHTADLRLEVAKFGQHYLNSATLRFNTHPPYWPRVEHPLIYPPFSISILVGEIAYNLRAALDYVVFELAKMDSGTPQHGTQFPMCEAAKDFAGWMKKRLVGINSAHIAAIERLQPYNGCKWTKTLQTISNPDKHRELTGTGLIATIEVVPPGFSASFQPEVSTDRHAKQPDGLEVNVKLIASIRISIRVENSAQQFIIEPLVKTCEQLVSDVRSALEGFKPEFK